MLMQKKIYQANIAIVIVNTDFNGKIRHFSI